MKWFWILAVVLTVVLVRGVSTGALSGPRDIPRHTLPYEEAMRDMDRSGKLRVSRPKVEQGTPVEPKVAADMGLKTRAANESGREPSLAKKRWVKVTANSVNVRMRPDVGSETVTSHSRDSRLQLLREREKWWLVLDPQTKTSGWMYSEYLDKIDPPQLASSATSG